MSNPQRREVHPNRPDGEPGAGPRYRDPGAPGAGRQDPRGFDPRWQDPRGFDPRWHDPRRSGGDPARRGSGGNGRDPQRRAPGDGGQDPQRRAPGDGGQDPQRRAPGDGGRDPQRRAYGDGDPGTGATTRRLPAQPGAAQPVPAQAAATSAGRPRPAQPGPDYRASGAREDLRGSGRAGRPRSARKPRGLGRWGSLPGGLGVCIIIASAAVGAVATVATRTDPGRLLGVCVVAGTVVAALAVRPSAGRLIFPVPSLFYLIAALAAGIAHDRSADSSRTALAISATQWIADGFFAMALATVLAIVLTAVRWYIWRRRRRAAAAAGWPQDDTGEVGGRADRLASSGWNDPGQRPAGPQGFARPDQRSGRGPDPRTGPPPGSGPYNFSSGA
jgi:hypothetical protein